jgi:hypothetical protein
MSLSEIYAHVQRQNPSALPETHKAEIVHAWREGRLPLIADEVRKWTPGPTHTLRPRQAYLPPENSQQLQQRKQPWSTPVLYEIALWRRNGTFEAMAPQAVNGPEGEGWQRVVPSDF